MISRRALFGIGAGAVTAALVPVPELRAETYFTDLIVSMDFGKDPAMIVWLPNSAFTHVERCV